MVSSMLWHTVSVRTSTCHSKSCLLFRSTLSRTRLSFRSAWKAFLKRAITALMLSARFQFPLTLLKSESFQVAQAAQSMSQTTKASCGDSRGSRAILRACSLLTSSWSPQPSAKSGTNHPSHLISKFPPSLGQDYASDTSEFRKRVATNQPSGSGTFLRLAIISIAFDTFNIDI